MIFMPVMMDDTRDQSGQRPGKPGKVREFETYLKNLEKSGNFIIGQGKWIMSQIYVIL